MDVLIWLFRLLIGFSLGLFRLSRWAWRRVSGYQPRQHASHGSSRWARGWEQWWYGLFRGEGVILGRGAFGRMIRFSLDGLVMVFAATGAGKGLGIVIPSLLTYRGSMVVTDPKGENYAITRRQRATFGKVRMLNPSQLRHSDRYNPLDIIRAGTSTEVDDATALAELMVKPDSSDGHWDRKAISILKALILHTLQEPPASRTLAHVRRLSSGMRETLIDTLQQIATSSRSLAAREIAAGAMASAINSDGNFSPEFGSILSNLQKSTEPWSGGAPAGTLSASSTFSLEDLTDKTTTLYLCVDEEFLSVYDLWLRVMVGCILKTLTRAKGRRTVRKVVLLLDEVAVLGRLDALENQAGLLRAYCTPVLIWQNLPQMQKVYREDAKAFLGNASARVFFGVSDNDTAEYVAAMLGNTTTLSSSSGISSGGTGGQHRNHQQGQAESGYWLLDPSEVQGLPLKRMLMRIRGVPFPLRAKRLDYRKIWAWRGLWDSWTGVPHGLNEEPREPDDEPDPPPEPSTYVPPSRQRPEAFGRTLRSA